MLFSAFLQGLLFLQTYNYFENYPKDRLGLKIFVALLWLLDFSHLILAGQTTYHYLVTSWGDVSALAHATVGLDMHLLLIALVALMSQSFYLYRIYLIGHKNWKNYFLVGFLALGCLAMFGLALTLPILYLPKLLVSSFANPRWVPIGVSMFALGAVFDTLIAGVMCYYLQKGRTGFRKTNTMIMRVMQYTLATGLATTALAIATLIMEIVLLHSNSLVFIAMHFSLGRVYTNAVVYSLNSRQRVVHNDNSIMSFRLPDETLESNGSVPLRRKGNKPHKALEVKVSEWKTSLPTAQV